MAEQTFRISEVHAGLANMVGNERAKEIVDKAVHEESLTVKDEYLREDISRILGRIRAQGGLIAVVASAMKARLLIA